MSWEEREKKMCEDNRWDEQKKRKKRRNNEEPTIYSTKKKTGVAKKITKQTKK